MREISNPIIVYTIDELSEDAEEKAIDEILNIERSAEEYASLIETTFSNKFDAINCDSEFNFDETSYDYIIMSGNINMSNYINHNKQELINNDITETDINFMLKIAKEHTNELIYHVSVYNTENIQVKDILGLQVDNEEIKVNEDLTNNPIVTKFMNYMHKIMREEIAEEVKEGHDWFYNVSNDEIIKFCEENNYEFLEDGSIYL